MVCHPQVNALAPIGRRHGSHQRTCCQTPCMQHPCGRKVPIAVTLLQHRSAQGVAVVQHILLRTYRRTCRYCLHGLLYFSGRHPAIVYRNKLHPHVCCHCRHLVRMLGRQHHAGRPYIQKNRMMSTLGQQAPHARIIETGGGAPPRQSRLRADRTAENEQPQQCRSLQGSRTPAHETATPRRRATSRGCPARASAPQVATSCSPR